MPARRSRTPPPPEDPAVRMARALQANDVANSAFESAGIQVLRLVVRLEHPGDAPAEQDAEVLRRFLVFLNAAHALVTQTAGMAAAVFPMNPLAHFMEEFRTCMKHRAVPRLSLIRLAPPAPRLVALHMDVSEMPAWPHWSPAARRFLHQHQPALPLHSALHDYQQAVRMFRQRAVRCLRAVMAEG